MHFYCLVRGDMLQVDQFKATIRAMQVPFRYNPKEPPGVLEVACRRVELLELAFPEEQKQKVIGALGPMGTDKLLKATVMYAVRKALGARQLKPGEVVPRVPGNGGIIRPFVDVLQLGIRKDGYRCKANPGVCNRFSRKKEICCGYEMVEDL